MRVLVTGATTRLGRAVIDASLRDHEVELVVATAHARELGLPATVIFEPADPRHARDMHDLVWRAAVHHRIDTVIHLGAPRDPVAATRQLVKHCAEHPTIRRLVYRSFGDVYAIAHATCEWLDEDAALDFDPAAPAWLRQRVEADLAVTSHAGGELHIAVLRLAELLAPDSGSQLWDYLSSRVCVRPLGFDPMINVLAIEDAVVALWLAARSTATGAFNIPGADTLPLSRAITESGRGQIAMPRRQRLRLGGLLDGTRARDHLGYVPHHPVRWPRAWWRVLIERLAASAAS